MQRGGAGRVSTASPGAHSARRRRPARPEPWGQRAEEQVLEAEPRQRRAAAAQVRPGPGGGPGNRERSAAGAAGAAAAAGSESREKDARNSESGSPRREVQPGLRSPQLLAPPGQGEEQAGDSEAGLFWRLEAPRRVEGRSDTFFWPAARKGPSSEQPPAGLPEKPRSPGESGRVARRAPARDLRGAFEGLGRAQPEEPRAGLAAKGKSAAAGRATPRPGTHPPHPPRPSRGAPLGALVPRRLLSRVPAPLGYRLGWRGPWGCPNQAWWPSGCSPRTSVKAGVRRSRGDSAQGPPRSRTRGGGRSARAPERRRPVGPLQR